MVLRCESLEPLKSQMGHPIVVICMWTAPYVSHSNDHLTAIRRRERAPSTTSKREAALFGLMSASTSYGHNRPSRAQTSKVLNFQLRPDPLAR